MNESGLGFQKIEVFCLVASLGSVTRAAEHLGIAQPLVTRHLRGLEHQLGVKLVEKVGRNIELTEAGSRVQVWCEEMLSRARELRRELSELHDGTMGNAVIAASMTVGSYLLPSLLSAFLGERPRAFVTTRISDPRSAIESVVAGSSDFAMLLLDARRLVDDVIVEGLWKEKLILVSANDSRHIGEGCSLEALATLPFVSTERQLVRREIEEEQLRQFGIVRQNIVIEFGHAEAMKRAVRADLGVALLLESSVREDIDAGSLREVKIDAAEFWAPIFLVHRERKVFSPLQASLLDFIRRAKPPWLMSI